MQVYQELTSGLYWALGPVGWEIKPIQEPVVWSDLSLVEASAHCHEGEVEAHYHEVGVLVHFLEEGAGEEICLVLHLF